MVIGFSVLLMLVALALFVAEGIRARSLLAIGLACWVLAELVGKGSIHIG